VNGYIMVSETPAGGVLLLSDTAVGDFDGDGRMEAAMAGDGGGLVLFEITGQGATWEGTVPTPAPLSSTMLAFPALGGDTELLTLEQDPQRPQVEGDLDRSSTRVRRWRHDGASLIPDASLAFSGMHLGRELQLLLWNGNALLRRGNEFNLVMTTGINLSWGGRLFVSSQSRVDGAVLTRLSASLTRMLWVGSSSGSSGDQVFLAGADTTEVGSSLQAIEARTIPGGIQVNLGWEPDVCGLADSLWRDGDVRGGSWLPVSSRTATDTLAQGERAVYFLTTPLCPARNAVLFGGAVEALAPRWDGGRLVLDFGVPLRRDVAGTIHLPREVLLYRGGGLENPRIVHIRGEGTGLLIEPLHADSESLIVIGAWDENGLPVGGAYRSSVPLSPPPAESAPPVLAKVTYHDPGSAPFLDVEFHGDEPGCEVSFRLQPVGWDLDPPSPLSPDFTLDLPGPLTPGSYMLQLLGACLPAPEEALGLERSFRVGLLLYPNPLRSGDDLVLENLEPGSTVEVHDVAGSEQLSWRVESVPERRLLNGLAPGLYFLRIRAPSGELLGIEKLAVIR
jgi:hypothetical protein